MNEFESFDIEPNGDITIYDNCPGCGNYHGTRVKRVYLAGINEASEVASDAYKRIQELRKATT